MISPSPSRLAYLDWLRVAAFALLILYHVGMFYVTWDWHVKSDRAGHAIEPLMLLTNPWRLTLLFFVSGAATRFMADKMSAAKLAGKRTVRLLVPLVFAMLFLEFPELRNTEPFADWAPVLAMMSPFTVMMHLFNEMGSRFPRDISTAPFYTVHGALLALALVEIRRRGRRLRAMYLAGPVREAS